MIQTLQQINLNTQKIKILIILNRSKVVENSTHSQKTTPGTLMRLQFLRTLIRSMLVGTKVPIMSLALLKKRVIQQTLLKEEFNKRNSLSRTLTIIGMMMKRKIINPKISKPAILNLHRPKNLQWMRNLKKCGIEKFHFEQYKLLSSINLDKFSIYFNNYFTHYEIPIQKTSRLRKKILRSAP